MLLSNSVQHRLLLRKIFFTDLIQIQANTKKWLYPVTLHSRRLKVKILRSNRNKMRKETLLQSYYSLKTELDSPFDHAVHSDRQIEKIKHENYTIHTVLTTELSGWKYLRQFFLLCFCHKAISITTANSLPVYILHQSVFCPRWSCPVYCTKNNIVLLE